MINSLMPGCYDMFCSMLKDLSPYGVAGRENQTDDLSLTIDMGLPVSAGIHGVALYLWTEKISDQQTQTFRSETVMYQPLT